VFCGSKEWVGAFLQLDKASYVWLPLLPVEGVADSYLIIAHLEKNNKTLSPWVVGDYLGKTTSPPPARTRMDAQAIQEETRWAEAPTPSQGRASGLAAYAGPPLDGLMHISPTTEGAVAEEGFVAESLDAPSPAEAEESFGKLDSRMARAGLPAPSYDPEMVLA
jgi:hypothetical protein